MKRNYYNLYKDGNLIKENVTSAEIAKIVGMKSSQISSYVWHDRPFGDGYRAVVVEKIQIKPKEGQTKDDELLNVWDDEKQEFIYKNIKRKDVCKMFNLTSYKLSQYIAQNMYIQDRYLVSRVGETLTRWPQDLIDKWNEAVKAAELLRTGKGKMVRKYVNGKLKKYVEVIK